MIELSHGLMIGGAETIAFGLSAQVETPEVKLTGGGALIMGVCIVGVLALLAFCLARILHESRPEEHHHAPLEIDTHDGD